MTTGCLTHPCRMKISTFDKYICCSFCRTGIQSTEYTGNTHSFFLIADHQVTFVQLTFHTIQCHKRSTFRHRFHNYFPTLDFICIKAVQRLSESMNNIIGDIYYIINRPHTNKMKFILQPFRAFFHCHPLYSNTGIARTCFTILYCYLNIKIMIFYGKSLY